MIRRTPLTSRRQVIALAIGLVVSVLVVATAQGSFAASQSCPNFGSATNVGELTRDNLREASGLVASHNHDNRYWTHNDSGDSARIYAINGSGEDRGVVNLGGINARDFEDIAIGPGPKSGKDYIYVADIGNNGHSRSTLWIYRFEEPSPPGKGKSMTIPGNKIERFEYVYEKPGDPGKTWRRNGEALFVDPISKDVVIIEKQLTTVSGKKDMGWVYRISQSALKEGQVIKAKPKVAIRQRRSNNYGPTTAADISPDGKTIIVKNGSETFAWKRNSGQSVYDAFKAFPISSCYPPSTPGEAIAFTRNGNAVLSITEKRNSPVKRFAFHGNGGGGGGGGTTTTTKAPTTTTTTRAPQQNYECAGRPATIVGTHGDDVIVGTDGRDVIVGLGGNDVIRGLKGRDIICGGPGRDEIYGNQGKDEIHGGEHNDVLKGGYHEDYLVGGQGRDRVHGQNGDDYVAGALGNDRLYGGHQVDFLVAGEGTDKCFGGKGNDDYQSCE